MTAGAASTAASGAPQSPQKRFSGGFSAPHAAQTAARAVPQSPQKRFPAGFSLPQPGQSTVSIYAEGAVPAKDETVVLRRHTMGLLAATAAVSYTAATASPASALEVPISAIHALAQTFEPGVYLPTAFPRSINKVDVGGASGIGNGPAPAHFLEYFAGSHGAFQLGIWRGSKAAAVVRGLLFHD